jgi:glucose-6-phosphate isomerase
LYASLVGINANHQPGVEAGKKAATGVIAVQHAVVAALEATPPEGRTAAEIADAMGAAQQVETVYKVLEHLAANGRARQVAGTGPAGRYSRHGTPR